MADQDININNYYVFESAYHKGVLELLTKKAIITCVQMDYKPHSPIRIFYLLDGDEYYISIKGTEEEIDKIIGWDN